MARAVSYVDQKAAKEAHVAKDVSQEVLPVNYKLVRLIGRGSYGEVWEAYDHLRKRQVAVKKVGKLFQSETDTKRTLRELAIMSRLQHNNIVRLLDIPGIKDPRTFTEVFLVMDMCTSDLQKLIRTGATLLEIHVVALLYNLLLGLRYLHSAGVYHRDLKPANCLVNADCTVKICDFNLACLDPNCPGEVETQSPCASQDGSKDSDEETNRPMMCRQRSLTKHVASRWYRAPELILVQPNYTEAIDIWASGCIFGELLTLLEGGLSNGERRALFPGASCFPLSPNAAHAGDIMYHVKAANEQLNMIFNLIGTPDNEDLKNLDSYEAKRYVQSFGRRGGDGLRAHYPHVKKKALLQILEDMLDFNPHERPPAAQLLCSEVFDEVRMPSLEVPATTRVLLNFDDGSKLKEATLRTHFCDEIGRFHKAHH